MLRLTSKKRNANANKFLGFFPFKLTKVKRIKWPVLKSSGPRALCVAHTLTQSSGRQWSIWIKNSKNLYSVFSFFVILCYDQTHTKIYASMLGLFWDHGAWKREERAPIPAVSGCSRAGPSEQQRLKVISWERARGMPASERRTRQTRARVPAGGGGGEW